MLLAGGLIAACGNEDDAEPLPTPRVDPGEVRAVSDEEYLAIICTGLEEFSSALIRADSPEEIIEVVQAYIDSLVVVEPPEDVQPFHNRFVGYLDESLEDPGQLVMRPRPLPEDDVRERLAEVERDVDECQDLVFFAERQDDVTR